MIFESLLSVLLFGKDVSFSERQMIEEIGTNTVIPLVEEVLVTAPFALVVEREQQGILFSKDELTVRPIASLTKLMTALVFWDTQPSFDEFVPLISSEFPDGMSAKVGIGEKIRVKDLFSVMLIASSNDAVMTLVSASGLSEYKFVQRMNERALSLGMDNTRFVEPTGLSPLNTSTAADVATLLDVVLRYEEIRRVTTSLRYSFQAEGDDEVYTVLSTNRDLLQSQLNHEPLYSIIGGKTGYTEEAGYCLALAVVNNEGREILSVVLGEESRAASIKSMKDLVGWGFKH
jgi:D-alanyl-D-alanine endopeptidase (penicillin-binding protein 7)